MESRVILLRVCHNARAIAELSIDTGVACIKTMPSVHEAKASPFHGFLADERGYSKSVYAHDGRLYLQIGSERWDLNEHGFRIVLERLSRKRNRVRVEAWGEIVFSEDYPSALSDPVNAGDPTFDALDEEFADFWVWLCRCASNPNWRSGVLKLWSQGKLPTGFVEKNS